MEFNTKKIEEILKIKIKERIIFETAFTHRSYLNEHADYDNPSNERLEFLGDAVLQLISSEYLYNNYEDPEGILTNYRSAIVCTESLAAEAGRLGFGDLLYLSNGEEASGGRKRPYILANTFEAVLGALYIDQGIEKCTEFVTNEVLYKIGDIIKNEKYKDSKSLFQEVAQEKKGFTPIYKVIDSWGADHERIFKVGVFLDDKEYGVGEGGSKQKAEQKAAQEGLDNINSL